MPIYDATKAQIFLCVGPREEVFDYWTDCHVEDSLLDASCGAMFHSPVIPDVNDRSVLVSRGLVKGALATIKTRSRSGNDTPVMQGRIDDVVYQTSREHGSNVTVQFGNHMRPIVDSDAPPNVAMVDSTFRDVILTTLAPFGFTADNLRIDNDANRSLLTGKAASGVVLSPQAPHDLTQLKIDKARPHPGETVYTYLERLARRFGLIMWGTADGCIVFGRPNYDQRALYKIVLKTGYASHETNAEWGTRRSSSRHIPSEVQVYGKSHGHDWARADVHAVVKDEATTAAGFYRVRTVSDRNVRTKAEAEHRAKYELSVRKQHAESLQFRMAGFEQNGALYAIDTIADVDYPVGEAVGPWYVTRRTFTFAREQGGQTLIDLVPKGSIAIGDVPYSDRAEQ